MIAEIAGSPPSRSPLCRRAYVARHTGTSVSSQRVVLAAVALATLLLGAGCLGGGPQVVEQDCGNVGGVGGCAVTVENPTDEAMEVEVTVEAVDADGNVVASGTETVLVAGNSREEVTVGASNAGGEVDRYEVSVQRAS